jgi:uncharacterized protein YjbJ (UPF0337 family)
MLNQNQIKGNWKQIKGGIRNLWGKISDEELDQLSENISAVAGLVQEKYGETTESINSKIDRLMESFDNDQDKRMILNDHETSYLRNPTSSRNAADNPDANQ